MPRLTDISRLEAPTAPSGLVQAGLYQFGAWQSHAFSAVIPRALLGMRITGLDLPISSLHSGNPDQARALYCGEFSFAGEKLLQDEQPVFSATGMSKNWQSLLHGFSWLAHMKAGGRELSRVQTRALICRWIKTSPKSFWAKPFSVPFASDVLARRIISFVQHGDFILAGAGEAFEKLFFTSLSTQIRVLYSRTLSEPNGLKRLQAAIALVVATHGFSGIEYLRKKALEKLSSELSAQIFADGGHISRNPQVLRDLLADLVPIRMALEKARLEVPVEINSALERMLPALRFFTSGDGGLAVFNGVSDTSPGLVKKILATDIVYGRPLTHAPHTGYVRLQQAGLSILVDTGKPVMPTVSRHSSAGLMAFEFCDNASRIVTNCGSLEFANPHWRAASRSTQAHSSVCIDNQPPGNILNDKITRTLFGGSVVLSAEKVDVETSMGKQGAIFCGRHNGYVKSFGVVHERRLFLGADGKDLRGEDCFIADLDATNAIEAAPYTIRFHLHPSVRVTMSQDRASAMLLLADKTGWRFSARGGQLKLEDSVYLPEGGRIRKTSQLVLVGIIGRPDKVQWAFKKIEKRKGASRKPAASPNRAPTLF